MGELFPYFFKKTKDIVDLYLFEGDEFNVYFVGIL